MPEGGGFHAPGLPRKKERKKSERQKKVCHWNWHFSSGSAIVSAALLARAQAVLLGAELPKIRFSRFSQVALLFDCSRRKWQTHHGAVLYINSLTKWDGRHFSTSLENSQKRKGFKSSPKWKNGDPGVKYPPEPPWPRSVGAQVPTTGRGAKFGRKQ